MARHWRGFRVVRAALAGALLVYAALALIMFASQRPLLFVGAGGASAVAGGPVIAGSTRLTLKTADGETLAAWYVAAQPDRPVFLFLHGNGGGLHRMTGRWQRIREAGAGVLAVSYRGYAGSTGAPSEAGLIEDARTAYAWLAARHRPERIVIHGLSLGTGVAVALATSVTARALVLEAPYTATVDVAAERYPWLPVHWLMLDTFKSRERIGRVRMPVLIAHGTADSVIPFAHGRRLFELSNEPKTFVAMPGGDHATLVRDGLYAHIWQFLAAR